MVAKYKKMYICVYPDGGLDLSSISYCRYESISRFLQGSSMTWTDAKKSGNICKKVSIQIKEINP